MSQTTAMVELERALAALEAAGRGLAVLPSRGSTATAVRQWQRAVRRVVRAASRARDRAAIARLHRAATAAGDLSMAWATRPF